MNPIQCLEHFKPLWQAFRYKVLFSGRGSGKSAHLCIFLIWLACRAKIKILCLREFQVSIEESMKAEIEKWIDISGTRKDWIINLRYIKHKHTGSKFIFRGIRNNPKSIKSMTDIGCAVFEECEDATKESIDLLIPTLRLAGSFFIFAGNPKDRLCAVAQMFTENEPPPSTVVISNSYLYNPFCSKELIAEADFMRLTNEALYNHIWLGQYLDVSSLVMVRKITRAEHQILGSYKCVIGVDIAREGGDSTVICVRKGKAVASLLVFATMDITRLTHELQSLIHIHKPEQINIDSTGHGAWAPDALKAYGIIVKSVNFAGNADKNDKYSNKRTEIYGLANDYFEKGGTIRPGDVELEEELEASYYTLDNKNRSALVPKTEIKKKLKRSPDRSDAFCLSLICPGDMFVSTHRAELIQSANLGKELIKAGSF